VSLLHSILSLLGEGHWKPAGQSTHWPEDGGSDHWPGSQGFIICTGSCSPIVNAVEGIDDV